MEPWFSEAKSVAVLDSELCFLLKDDFYFGPDRYVGKDRSKFMHTLSLPNITRAQSFMISTAELAGHEHELAEYYEQVVASAIRHKLPFNSIRHYFWVRFSLWNTGEDVHISFPWYDSYSEIEHFMDALISVDSGLVHHDIDQGWEMEIYAHEGNIYIKQSDPETETTHICICVRRLELVLRLQQIMVRSRKSIQALAASLGQDVWTSYVRTEPVFMTEKKHLWQIW